MSEAKHTPGPWRTVARHGMGGDKTTVGSSRYGAVADCGGCSISLAMDLANAHLIAAAPDLLEALREIHNIAAAPRLPENVNEDWPTVLTRRLGEILHVSQKAIAKAEVPK